MGDNASIPINVRIISATNRDLERLVQKGKFRKDLFTGSTSSPSGYRPLRERPEDIPLLAEAFIKSIGLKTGKSIHTISPDAMALLMSHAWPGNVRELKSAFEYALSPARRAASNSITSPPTSSDTGGQAAHWPQGMTRLTSEEVKRSQLISALQQTHGKPHPDR